MLVVNLVNNACKRLTLKDSLIDLMKGDWVICRNTCQSSAGKNLFYTEYCLLYVNSEVNFSAAMLSKWIY